jgi:hypothetical protein
MATMDSKIVMTDASPLELFRFIQHYSRRLLAFQPSRFDFLAEQETQMVKPEDKTYPRKYI